MSKKLEKIYQFKFFCYNEKGVDNYEYDFVRDDKKFKWRL